MARTWTRIVATVFVFWLMVILYMGMSMIQSPSDGEAEFKLKRALEQLDSMRQQNGELKQMVEGVRQIRLKSANNVDAKFNQENTAKVLDVKEVPPIGQTKSDPGEEHERLRRKIDNGVTEFWYYLRAKLKHMKSKAAGNPNILSTLDEVLEDGGEQERSIITDIHHLGQSDNAAAWRAQEAKDLSELVQRRLHYLQNPKDCKTAKKISCDLNKACGYGCQIHHAVYCFIVAYGSGRTLILKSAGWRYNTKGWAQVFKPLSDTCLSDSGSSFKPWGAAKTIEDTQVVSLPIIDSFRPRPDYMPLAIPEDLAPRLMRLHGHPFVWWIGQFLKYMLRPQPPLQSKMDEAAKALGFQKPIVGVHVRRTDKVGTEAAYHGIEEYMVHVEEYYKLIERRKKVDKRRVFLASDDPSVLVDARQKYPDYEFVSDPQISKSAGLGSRYTDSSLIGVVLDIHFLSQCDFVVCTFSSQVCRLAYEIMQTLHPDASSFFRSLDDIYYFGGQNGHREKAIYKHLPRRSDEIALNPGDEVGIAGNHWDGYSKGKNIFKGGGKAGLYPSYKTVDKTDIAKMPTYPEADNQ